MSSLRLLLLFVVWITVVAGEPLRAQKIRRALEPALSPVERRGKTFLTKAAVDRVLHNAPRGARLIATKPRIPSLHNRLPDNYTLIRENVVDTFKCDGRDYGYYADFDNECQIFHLCMPLRQIFPDSFTTDITYHFSFICPEHTIFSQNAMVCAWTEEALPCEVAEELYKFNKNFFRKVDKEDGTGQRYAHVNEPLP